MVKLRQARYCNLKLFLMYLTAYGHLIEPEIERSALLIVQYRFIYLFHMPLFAFLTGLFLRDERSCGRQCRKMLLLYAPLQLICTIFSGGSISLLTPCWHLWYLLSSGVWAALGGLWLRFGRARGRLPLLLLCIVAGCAAGYVPFIGRTLSLSRTIVFFPYFLCSLFCRADTRWERLRPVGLIALVLVLVLMALWGRYIPAAFLYQAEPYGAVKNGFTLRLLCYLLGALCCLLCLAFVPSGRLPFTKAGADTLPAYLIHAPLAALLRQAGLPPQLYPALAALLLYIIFAAARWCGGLYGIRSTDRRDGTWPPFNRSTRNTPGRSTGSFSP